MQILVDELKRDYLNILQVFVLEPLQSNYFHSTADSSGNAQSSQTSEIWYKPQGLTMQGQSFPSSPNNNQMNNGINKSQ